MGVGKARVKMTRIDEAETEKYLKKCSYCEPTDEGRQRAAEIAANRVERAEKSAEKKKKKKQARQPCGQASNSYSGDVAS